MTKSQIIKKVNNYPAGKSGPKSRLITDDDLRKAFICAVNIHGTNGFRIHNDLGLKYQISKELIDKYLRLIFGTYRKMGRPLIGDERT